MIAGRESIETVRVARSERAPEIITGIAFDENSYELAVNLPNDGCMSNLPLGTIVEVPGVVSSLGVRGVSVGELPRPVAEICRREIEVSSLVVDASVKADRKLALQALLFDPVVTDIDVAQKLLDEYLRVHRKYLPRFWGK